MRVLLAKLALPSGPRRTAGLLSIFALLLFLRRPDALLHPQFWAEDGMFYVSALGAGFGPLFAPYSGYLHLAPRLVAFLASAFDPLFAPVIFAWSSLAITLLVLARVLSARLRLSHTAWLALGVVLIPDAREVLLNATNLQWVLAVGLVALLLTDDARRPIDHAGDVVFLVLAGLSGPFSLLLTPLFVIRAGLRRTRASFTLAAVVATAAGVQAWFIAHDLERPLAHPAPFGWLRVPEILGRRLGSRLFGGEFMPDQLPGLALGLVGVIVIMALAGLALGRGPHRGERWMIAASLGLILAAALFRFRREQALLLEASVAQRYFFVPQVLLLWLLAVSWPAEQRWLALTTKIFCAAFVLTNLPAFRFAPFTDFDWPRAATEIRAGRSYTFTVNPGFITIPCPARPVDLSIALARKLTPLAPDTATSLRNSFSLDGKFPHDPLTATPQSRIWCSWEGADEKTGSLVIGPFPAPERLNFAVSGYPSEKGNHLFVELVATHERIDARPANPGNRWRLVEVTCPPAWHGQPIIIVVIDGTAGPDGWLAVSEPLKFNERENGAAR